MTDGFESNLQQRNFWSGDFGNEYIDRNQTIEEVNELYKQQTGITVEEIFIDFFQNINKNSEILELGCNIGLNLSILKKIGFKNLNGVEINEEAYEFAKQKNPDIDFTNSSIENFNTNKKFDVVYTAGVLIHINPQTIKSIIEKMMNLSQKYIFGFEYFADELIEIPYHGYRQVCWKQNFPKIFTDSYTDLISLKEKKFKYKNENNIDVSYLFEKFNGD